MNVLIIYSHPNETSYNASILQTVQKHLAPEHRVKIVDLYKENFDPVLRFDERHKGEIYSIMKTWNRIEIYWVGRTSWFLFSLLGGVECQLF